MRQLAAETAALPGERSVTLCAIRSLSYADGHLLLDLVKLADAEPTRLQNELRRSGLVAIVAPTQNGARLRIGWE